MVVRNIVLSDDTDIAFMWNDNAPINRPIYEAMGINWPDWTFQQARDIIISQVTQGRARCGVYTPTPGGQVQGFGFALKRRQPEPLEDMIGLLIRLVRRPNGTINQAATQARLQVVATELLDAWARACKLDGINRCEGWYPVNGNATMLAYLDAMTVRNGIQPDLSTRPGWRGYAVTPDNIIIGVGNVP